METARFSATPDPGAGIPRLGAGELILLVDDEPMVCVANGCVLDAGGYNTMSAANGAEALDILTAQAGKIQVVITDLAMPVMNGVALVRALRNRHPGVRVIVVSGHIDGADWSELHRLAVDALLRKPYNAADLLGAVRRSLTLRATAG